MELNKGFYTQEIQKYWSQWQVIAAQYRDQEALKQQLSDEKEQLEKLLTEVKHQEYYLSQARRSVFSLWGRLTGQKSATWKSAEEALRKAKNTHYVKMILVEELEEKLQNEIDPTPAKTAYTNAIEAKLTYLQEHETAIHQQLFPLKYQASMTELILEKIQKMIGKQSQPLFGFLTDYQLMIANTHATQGASADNVETLDNTFAAQQAKAKIIQKANKELKELLRVYAKDLTQVEFYSQYIFQMPQWPNSISRELDIDQKSMHKWQDWKKHTNFSSMTGSWLSGDKLRYILEEINELKACLQSNNELLHHYQQTLDLYAYPFVLEDFNQAVTNA